MPSAPKEDRREADFYETPYWCIRILLDYLKMKHPRLSDNCKIVEPCAGAGAISREIKRALPHCTLIQHELREEEKMGLFSYGNDVRIGNFLDNTEVDESVEFVITNPPYSIAKEFVEKCHELYPNADIYMLLPMSFRGSDDRHEFWVNHILDQEIVLSDRPSFTFNGKSDSSVYAWMVWGNNCAKTPFVNLSNRYKTIYNKKAMEAFIEEFYNKTDMSPLELYRKEIKNRPIEREYAKFGPLGVTCTHR